MSFRQFVRSRRSRIVLAVLAVALPAVADAPENQYGQFDGSAQEVTDQFTGLHWDRRRVQQFTHADADPYCNQTVFMGSGRVPTVKELLTLVDEEPHEEYDGARKPPQFFVSIDPNAFPKPATGAAYWTSTPGPDGRVWTVEFTSGRTALADPVLPLNVRCVY